MTEPNLGPLFTAPLPESNLDADAVVRASRRRRLPRLIAVGAASTLVVVGAVSGIGVGLLHTGSNAGVASSAESQHNAAVPAAGASIPAPGADLGGVCKAPSAIPGDTVLCGCGAVSAVPVSSDLTAQLSFPAERVGHGVDGMITLTNTGNAAVSASAATPIGFFVTDAIIESPIGTDDSAAHDVQLAPGESMSLAVPFPAIDCAGSDAPAGAYEVGAVVDLKLSSGADVEVVAPTTKVAIDK